jgi:hypothetical protein
LKRFAKEQLTELKYQKKLHDGGSVGKGMPMEAFLLITITKNILHDDIPRSNMTLFLQVSDGIRFHLLGPKSKLEQRFPTKHEKGHGANKRVTQL